MRLTLEFYEHLRRRLRISDVVRKKVSLIARGQEYHGLCPFHDEKTPSFTVNDAKRFYHCFGCGAHGDIIRFVAELQGIRYNEAAVKIAQENNIELPKLSIEQEKEYTEIDQIHKILALAASFFVSSMTIAVGEYMTKRGISSNIMQEFEVGYAPDRGKIEQFFVQRAVARDILLKSGLLGKGEDNRLYEIFNKRIIFPIKNFYGKVIGFGGRTLDNAVPKYLNSPETIVFKKSEILFGENLATSYAHKKNYHILVEGYMDVVALHQAGFREAVASLGTAITKQQIQKLWRSSEEIIICLDGDNAGRKASTRIIDHMISDITTQNSLSFIEMPNGIDPADFIKAHGAEAFGALLLGRISLAEMIWKSQTEGKNLTTPEHKAVLEKKLESYCLALPDHFVRKNYQRYFKDQIWQNIVKYNGKNNSDDIQKSAKRLTETNKSTYNMLPQYSEIEWLERVICAFIIKYVTEKSNSNTLSTLESNEIKLLDQQLNDFKNYIIDLLTDGNDTTVLDQLLKNTRFYELYLVLSDNRNILLNTDYYHNNFTNKELIFEWYCKKHYFLLLKQEYIDALRQEEIIIQQDYIDNIQDKKNEFNHRSVSYLQEMQKISRELEKLNSIFIN